MLRKLFITLLGLSVLVPGLASASIGPDAENRIKGDFLDLAGNSSEQTGDLPSVYARFASFYVCSCIDSLSSGQYYDSESGMHYNYKRYYSPETGRYISVDPARDAEDYAYAGNNPYRLVDPTGTILVDTVMCGIASGFVDGPGSSGAKFDLCMETVVRDYASGDAYARAKYGGKAGLKIAFGGAFFATGGFVSGFLGGGTVLGGLTDFSDIISGRTVRNRNIPGEVGATLGGVLTESLGIGERPGQVVGRGAVVGLQIGYGAAGIYNRSNYFYGSGGLSRENLLFILKGIHGMKSSFGELTKIEAWSKGHTGIAPFSPDSSNFLEKK